MASDSRRAFVPGNRRVGAQAVRLLVDAIGEWHAVASDQGISAGTRALIGKTLSQAYRQNKVLLTA